MNFKVSLNYDTSYFGVFWNLIFPEWMLIWIELYPLHSSHVGALTPSVSMFGEKAFMEVNLG